MDFHLVFHGSPCGFDSLGDAADRNFLTRFHQNAKELPSELFRVDTLNVNSKPHFCYTFLKYGNVLEKDKRSGSYFGMSFVCDAACVNLQSMYALLRNTYRNKVVGTIVSEKDGVVQFLVSKFSEQGLHLRNIENTLPCGAYFNDRDFAMIPVGKGAQGAQLNPQDCSGDCRQLLANHSPLYIANNYPSQREIATAAQHASALQQKDNDLQTERNAVQRAQAEASRMEATVRDKERDIASLKNTIEAKDQQLKIAANEHVRAYLKMIEDEVRNSGKGGKKGGGKNSNNNGWYAGGQGGHAPAPPKQPKPSAGHQFKLLDFIAKHWVVVSVIAILVAGLLIATIAYNPSDGKKGKSNQEVNTESSASNPQSGNEQMSTTSQTPVEVEVDGKVIDVVGYKKKNGIKNQTYGAKFLKNQQGTWKFENAHLSETNDYQKDNASGFVPADITKPIKVKYVTSDTIFVRTIR